MCAPESVAYRHGNSFGQTPGQLHAVVTFGDLEGEVELMGNRAAGYAVPAADTAGLTFEGVATDQADNSAGSSGDVSVVVRRRGRYRFASASALGQSSISGEVCVSDDQTVADESDVTHDVVCGRIDRVLSAGECWMSIDYYASKGKAWTPATTTTTTAAG